MSEKKSMLDGEKQYHIQLKEGDIADFVILPGDCLLYTSPSPRDGLLSRMPSSA